MKKKALSELVFEATAARGLRRHGRSSSTG